MKQAQLRAAAHNLADSISSEVSMLGGGWNPFQIWDEIAGLPGHRLDVDLLTGRILGSARPPKIEHFLTSFSKHVPEFLQRHDCPADEVARVEVQFRLRGADAFHDREVTVIVEQIGGRRSTDRYIGWPLKRRRLLDALGRIRRDRTPRSDS